MDMTISADSRVATEAARRRSFAIIAHPDAGKTTLTEKLLLEGGAIQLAGQVRAKGDARRTRSDWMKIEQERGISVASSVMTFERDGVVFNLLDTPGHEDFSEDTYRTLTAVDAAVMVLDAAKGIESQTRKLFEVCRMRDIPIITFVNKMDREGRDPFDLLDEIEKTLALDAAPVVLADRAGGGPARRVRHPAPTRCGCSDSDEVIPLGGLDDPALDRHVPAELAEALREQAALAAGACAEFDLGRFLEGSLTPVFFGSALRDFGVGHLLEGLARFAPPPRPRPADGRMVRPEEGRLSGFVFKIQANMDPQHRDRVAFLRHLLGPAREGACACKQVRTGKQVPVNAPLFFFAKDRQVAEEAWPGDVVGIADPRRHPHRRHADRERGDQLPGRALLRAGAPAPGAARRPDAGQEAAQGARRTGR